MVPKIRRTILRVYFCYLLFMSLYIHVFVCGSVCVWLCVNGYACGVQKSASHPLKTGSLTPARVSILYSILKTYMEVRTHLLLKSLLVQDVAFVYCGSVPVLARTGSLCLEIPYQTHLWCPVSSHAGRQLSLVLQSYSIGFCHSTDHPVSLTCSSSVSLLTSLQHL